MKSSIGLVIQLSLVLLLLALNLSNQQQLSSYEELKKLADKQTSAAQVPVEWDWRKYGIVTPARNQESCGSCWSFVSAAALESHLMKVQIAEGKFDPKNQLTLSEQNLIDCSGSFGTHGCDGGNFRNAFEYVKETKGLNTINDYPYIGKLDSCHYNKEKRVDIDIKEIKRITTGSDQELVSAIYTHGPVTVGFHQTNKFLNYSSGIFDDTSCNAESISRSLLAVGYTPDYFILKNSWGTKWGEDGYIRLSRSKVNNCGVSQQAYYPVLANDVGTANIRDKLKESLIDNSLQHLAQIQAASAAPVPALPVVVNQPNIPVEWDWRKYGHLMKVQIAEGKFDPKNQLSLSGQNLIDCSTSFGNKGCNGGLWGTKWGEDGYIRLSRSKVNNCGVSQQAYYPVLANDVGTDKIRDKLKEKKKLIKKNKMKSSIGLVIQLSLVLLLLALNLSNQQQLANNQASAAPVPPLPVAVNTNIPVEWDWRKYGIVTPARDQGPCGACWSLVSAAALESHLMKVQIAEGKFDPSKQLSLSEQNLIDCSTSFGTLGCDGGNTRNAFEYVNITKGLNSINDYPYTGKLDSCHYNKEKRVDIHIKDIIRITPGSDQELVSAIYTYGPVTVAVDVTNKFANYSSGILDDITCNAENISAALLAVGYTPEYFILKNSWGTKWGENGYIRLSRSKVNNCGVSEQAYYPVLANDVGTANIRDKLKEVK
ncbi:uncharacterized protein LOC128962791 [Oppia nitens]|uniref:uncharacterized protein LOC128962791 n=1 Tax=Oppia nitens TaxID=1686743 RepID=UPI0023DC4A95|nr:uncharacterized protein LOC128962791 [Oppia nitens]